MLFAQVIIDISTLPSNKKYDYIIPNNLILNIKIGSRVLVNFGNRVVQGYVSNISNNSNLNNANIKCILGILDDTSIINNELFSLSKWLSFNTFTSQLITLKTILPNNLPCKYKKYFKNLFSKDLDIIKEFESKEKLLWTKNINKKLLKKLLREYKLGNVDIVYDISSYKHNNEYLISRILSDREIENIKANVKKNAKRQLSLLNFLFNLPLKRFFYLNNIILKSKIPRNVWINAAKKGWITLKQSNKIKNKNHFFKNSKFNTNICINKQENIVKEINNNKEYKVFLLEDNSNNRMSIYLKNIEYTLLHNKTVIFLLPNILLVYQTASLFFNIFGDKIAIFTSETTSKEKYIQWIDIIKGKIKIVIGTRSAIFVPFVNLGLIIIDEEQDYSYKQEESPRYHARNIALWRGQYNNCTVILGSSTPSLESRARAEKGKYSLIQNIKSIYNKKLSNIHIVNMSNIKYQNNITNYSPLLIENIKKTIISGKQCLLLLNKNGYSSFTICHSCGYIFKCIHCDIPMTFYENENILCCNYCGYKISFPKFCPNCHSNDLRNRGNGIERAEKELRYLLPNIRISRLDSKTLKSIKLSQQILYDFNNGMSDVLIGTRIVSKGINFSNLSLVGILNADITLNLPTFRSSEETFDLVMNTISRMDINNINNHAIIQTYNPDNYVIKCLSSLNYKKFFYHEMHFRHENNYSPYYFIIKLSISHFNRNMAAQGAFEIMNVIQSKLNDNIIVLGPTPFFNEKLSNRYYYQIFIKYKKSNELFKLLNTIAYDIFYSNSGYKLIVDRDPQ